MNQFDSRWDTTVKLFYSKLQVVLLGGTHTSKSELSEVDWIGLEEKISAKYEALRCINYGSHPHWVKECGNLKEYSHSNCLMTASFNAATLRAEIWYDSCYSSRGEKQHENEQAFRPSTQAQVLALTTITTQAKIFKLVPDVASNRVPTNTLKEASEL